MRLKSLCWTRSKNNSKFIARQQTALNVKLFMQKLTASPTRLPNMPSPTNMTNSWLPSVPTEQMPTPVSTLLATRKISPAIRLTTGQKFRQNVLRIAWSAVSILSWKRFTKKRICRWPATHAKFTKQYFLLFSHTILMEHKPYLVLRKTWRILQSPTSKNIIRNGMCPTTWLSVFPVILIPIRWLQPLTNILVVWNQTLICRNWICRKKPRLQHLLYVK